MINFRKRTYVLVVILLLVFVICVCRNKVAAKDDGEVPEGWRLFPRMGIEAQYGGYVVDQDNYASMVRRRLELDILQYRRNILYLEFDEQTFFGIPANKWEFNLMKYNIHFGYRYDFGDYYLGLAMQHECNNPFITEKDCSVIDRERANLYLIGPEFLTKNMRLGMKDRGINFESPNNFEFLGKWAGAASFYYTVVHQNAVLDWLIRAKVRNDFLRYGIMVPYLELGGDLLIGQVFRLAPTVELGARFHFSGFDLTPFFIWGRAQEFLTDQPQNLEHSTLISKNYLYGGARVEMLLDSASSQDMHGEGLRFLPEVHFTADYALYLQSQFFKAHGNNEFDFEALRWGPWTIFLYTDMNFNSRKSDYRPIKLIYWIEYGLTYSWEKYFIEGFVENLRRLDLATYYNVNERANLGGLRLGTKGMKPGHYNDGISFDGPKFQWLNNWNAQGYAAHYFQNRDWEYLWNLNAQVRWDSFRWYFLIPYLQGEINWQAGGGRTDNTLEYMIEPGLRFHGGMDLALYYRFQHRENVLFFRGPSENESLLGLKAMF
jgi:hypothetical protein